eukprot:3797622-Heterocapsa_arctica.AAC.1
MSSFFFTKEKADLRLGLPPEPHEVERSNAPEEVLQLALVALQGRVPVGPGKVLRSLDVLDLLGRALDAAGE